VNKWYPPLGMVYVELFRLFEDPDGRYSPLTGIRANSMRDILFFR